MPDLAQNQGIDIDVPHPVEIPESPVAPEILPPQEQPLPLQDPAPPLVEISA